MVPSSSLFTFNSSLLLHTRYSSLYNHHFAPVFKWGLRRNRDSGLVVRTTNGQAFRVLANPNVSQWKGSSKKEVSMVDPVEAKRLADKQMAEIKAKEKYKRRRQIEAINGAWAMIGLTAGLVIEGQTGNSILSQLAGYWAALISLFIR